MKKTLKVLSKRGLSLLIAGMMTASMMPMQAFAANSDDYTYIYVNVDDSKFRDGQEAPPEFNKDGSLNELGDMLDDAKDYMADESKPDFGNTEFGEGENSSKGSDLKQEVLDKKDTVEDKKDILEGSVPSDIDALPLPPSEDTGSGETPDESEDEKPEEKFDVDDMNKFIDETNETIKDLNEDVTSAEDNIVEGSEKKKTVDQAETELNDAYNNVKNTFESEKKAAQDAVNAANDALKKYNEDKIKLEEDHAKAISDLGEAPVQPERQPDQSDEDYARLYNQWVTDVNTYNGKLETINTNFTTASDALELTHGNAQKAATAAEIALKNADDVLKALESAIGENGFTSIDDASKLNPELAAKYAEALDVYNKAYTAYDAAKAAYNKEVEDYNTAAGEYNNAAEDFNGAVGDYNEAVDNFNQSTEVEIYNEAVDVYEEIVNEYNSKVDEHNDEAKHWNSVLSSTKKEDLRVVVGEGEDKDALIAKIQDLKGNMVEIKVTVDGTETTEKVNLETLKTEMDIKKTNALSSLTEADIDAYEKAAEKYNAAIDAYNEVVNSYNTLYDHAKNLDSYNKQIRENQLNSMQAFFNNQASHSNNGTNWYTIGKVFTGDIFKDPDTLNGKLNGGQDYEMPKDKDHQGHDIYYFDRADGYTDNRNGFLNNLSDLYKNGKIPEGTTSEDGTISIKISDLIDTNDFQKYTGYNPDPNAEGANGFNLTDGIDRWVLKVSYTAADYGDETTGHWTFHLDGYAYVKQLNRLAKLEKVETLQYWKVAEERKLGEKETFKDTENQALTDAKGYGATAPDQAPANGTAPAWGDTGRPDDPTDVGSYNPPENRTPTPLPKPEP